MITIILKFRSLIFIIILLFSWVFSFAHARTIGTPFVRNFERADYQGGFQTWSVLQGSNGMMYFGNNNGLMEYDGSHWVIYPLPNNSIVRAICKGREEVLYSGGFNEIGYYQLAPMGGASYTSLLELVPENDRDFGEIWKIFVHSDGVIFQSFQQIMIYKEDEIKVIKAPSSFHFSFLVNGEYYVNDSEKGLLRYSMGDLFPMIGLEELIGTELWAILPYNNRLMIATASDGVFLYNGNTLVEWNSEVNSLLKKEQIYSAIRLNDSQLAFGTIQNGLLICDIKGRPQQVLNWKDGLQNNTILCIGNDRLGNLWLGTDHGIDYVEINSPLTKLSYNYGLSMGYAAIIDDEILYLGTNQGLYAMDWQELQHGFSQSKPFRVIEEMRGQVWSLTAIGDDVFCGHNSGTFLIKDQQAKKISDVAGGWTYLELPSDSNKVIGGTYLGLTLFVRKHGQWIFSKQIPGFSESSRTLALDTDGSIWMAHGLKGVFHLKLNENYDSIVKVDFYNNKNSQLKDYAVNIAQTSFGVLFNSGARTYRFDNGNKKFELVSLFSSYLDGLSLSSLKEDKRGNLWYFAKNIAGVLRKQEDGSFNNINLPFRSLDGSFVNGFEFVYPFDETNVIFGTEYGFTHYNPAFKKSYLYPFEAYLKTMQTFYPERHWTINDSITLVNTQLNFSNNWIDFSFCANDFENSDRVLFSTKLEGFEKKWSDWNRRKSREFTNLSEGKYTFSVKAKNIYGTITEPVSLGFAVRPPWQRTIWAYISYVLLALLLLVLGAKWLRLRFDNTKKRVAKQQRELFRKKEEKMQREALEAEKQVIKLRNDKLREEMKKKDKELANSTMNTLHKNETMISIKKELNKISKSLDNNQNYPIQHLIKKINKEIDNENQWKIFETHFESVHEAFLTRIKNAYPMLTPRELKLCAYLRMNISSKEIAVLMNISTRGVEISRYRLRKKFDLSRDENLTDFILSF